MLYHLPSGWGENPEYKMPWLYTWGKWWCSSLIPGRVSFFLDTVLTWDLSLQWLWIHPLSLGGRTVLESVWLLPKTVVLAFLYESRWDYLLLWDNNCYKSFARCFINIAIVRGKLVCAVVTSIPQTSGASKVYFSVSLNVQWRLAGCCAPHFLICWPGVKRASSCSFYDITGCQAKRAQRSVLHWLLSTSVGNTE